ncbi:MAG: 50S ribosomal protein L6 [Deltaproteobacteria bacterium RIFOXYA12_FULL_58_15]|nr:MAG: 50S ribosomal protein L6 [Deltaproteobacteria bacterium RIFOXYA12_FULL_58_15]OGR15331.1 MAG: 50S ribosomal protein L6 [Deltaproteobacteria bacterium RIFOXYB12_FULL_58_9]
MSRIGRKPVEIPNKVKIEVVDQLLKVTGPLGNLQENMPEGVTVNVSDKVANVGAPTKNRQNRGYQGLVRALLANMVVGVTKGYERKLEIHGVGYKAEAKGDGVLLSLGYSHQINFKLPKGVKAEIEKNTLVTIKGIDKQAVGQVAAQIRGFRGPEPYKGKGVRYLGEQIRRKVGKAGAK